MRMYFRLIFLLIFVHFEHGFAFNIPEFLNVGKIPSDVLKEAFMEPIDLLKLYGYSIEQHNVTTKDRYKLSIHRISNTYDSSIPFLLMHGMGCTSTEFFLSQSASPAFLLANANFDVWMGNFRGGPYTSHTKYTREDNQFWRFSWEEMASYDLPEIIDYILHVTKKPKLLLGAQSLGTTVAFGLFSNHSAYNDKVAAFFAITPVAYTNYLTSLFYSKIKFLAPFLNYFGDKSFASTEGFLLNFSMALCSRKDFSLCALTTSIVGGFDPYMLNRTRMPIYIAHSRYGTSVKNILHLAQIMKYKEMRKYDYGVHKNLVLYNSTIPPVYDLSAISVPIVIFYGANDALADPLDVELLCRSLKSLVGKELIPWPLFSHTDSVQTMNGKALFYDKLIMYAKKLWLRL